MPGQPFALRYTDKEYACEHAGRICSLFVFLPTRLWVRCLQCVYDNLKIFHCKKNSCNNVYICGNQLFYVRYDILCTRNLLISMKSSDVKRNFFAFISEENYKYYFKLCLENYLELFKSAYNNDVCVCSIFWFLVTYKVSYIHSS